MPDKSIPKDWRRPDFKQSFEILKCDTCRYGFIFPRPEASDIPDFYKLEKYYTHQVDGEKRTDNYFTFFRRLRHHLAWRLDDGKEPSSEWWAETIGPKPLSILEIGCGNGRNLKVLEKLGHEVVGIEPDQQALETAISGGCTVYGGTAEEIPDKIKERKFHVVVMSHVLEHTLDPTAALANARKLISDDGRIIIEVPNNDSLGCQIIGTYWSWLDAPRHLNFFGIESLIQACSNSGISIIKTEYRGYSRQFSENWLATENQIYRIFENDKSGYLADAKYWKLFIRSAFSKPRKKFDSVRVIGIKAV